jgi:hypothetical protein
MMIMLQKTGNLKQKQTLNFEDTNDFILTVKDHPIFFLSGVPKYVT